MKNRDVPLQSYALNGYQQFCVSPDGRGVIIYCKNTINMTLVDELTNSEFNESCWVRLKLKDSDS